MIVRRVSAKGFATYPTLDRAFPERGLVLIVGDNGAGKSVGGYEVASWVLHGEIMRGKKVEEAKGELHFGVRGEEYVVKRSRTARTHKLSLDCGIVGLTGATPTETQKKIDELVGSHERFAATAVFARDLLAKFALATDKQRKALLEEALGLGQYDRALAAATAQKQIAKGALAVADAKVPLYGSRVAELEARVASLRAASVRPITVIEDETKALIHSRAPTHIELGPLIQAVDEAELALRAAEAAHRRQTDRARDLERQIAQQHEGCPACGRPYDASSQAALVADLQEQLEALGDRGARAHQRAKVAYDTSKEELQEQSAARAAVERETDRREAAYKALCAELKMARTWQEQVDAAKSELAKAVGGQAAAVVERDEAARRLRLMEAACVVLGPRGARVLQLARALVRLEHEANVFLGQVHPCLRVQVRAEEEAVVLRVQGAGGGDYKGCSGSQRVLVDVSLMMGLAAMRSADGILVFDEVFDSLDTRYAEAVAAYLQEQARLRQVVVISHHEQARSMFRPTACWRARLDGDGFSYLEDA